MTERSPAPGNGHKHEDYTAKVHNAQVRPYCEYPFAKPGLYAKIYSNQGLGFAALPGDDDDTITAVLAQAADNAGLLRPTVEAGVMPAPSPGKGIYGYRSKKALELTAIG